MPVRVRDDSLLHFKQPHFRRFLRRHVVVAALSLYQVSVFTEPSKKPELPCVHAVLLQDFCKFTHQDAGFLRGNAVCEQHLGLVLLHLSFKLLSLLFFLFQLCRKLDQKIR